MKEDIKTILINEEQIEQKVSEIAKKISSDYAGKNLVLIGILKGSVIFMSDLMKKIDIPCKMDFMSVSSYGNSTKSSGVVRIIKDLDFQIEGKDLLIVEDIVDSGITLKYLMGYLNAKKPASINIACFLSKPERREVEIDVKYLGFEIPDYFVVGYGLDFAENYRNLPYVGVLKEELYKK